MPTRFPQPPLAEGQQFLFDGFPWAFVARLAARGARWSWRQQGQLTLVRLESDPLEVPGFVPVREPMAKADPEPVVEPEKPRLVARRTIAFDLLQLIPPALMKDKDFLPIIEAYISRRKKLERSGCSLWNSCRTVHPGAAVPLEKCVCACESPCDFDPNVVVVEGQQAQYFDDFVKYLRLIGIVYDRIRREKAKGGSD